MVPLGEKGKTSWQRMQCLVAMPRPSSSRSTWGSSPRPMRRRRLSGSRKRMWWVEGSAAGAWSLPSACMIALFCRSAFSPRESILKYGVMRISSAVRSPPPAMMRIIMRRFAPAGGRLPAGLWFGLTCGATPHPTSALATRRPSGDTTGLAANTPPPPLAASWARRESTSFRRVSMSFFVGSSFTTALVAIFLADWAHRRVETDSS
mmetsp:Transcript_13678/g.39879  ORF Transcript_13678/g.39879 Transcript_13678/m.39879 type:complete len:206 (+) Transcript_13678:1621-2238(+)